MRVDLPYEALAGLPSGFGLALRIGSYRGRFEDDPRLVERLAALARELVNEAAVARVTVTELQVDFDGATSKLADYAILLGEIRSRLEPTPLTFTALPSWFGNRRGFRRLLTEADCFVLQVHGLPASLAPQRLPSLCDPRSVRRAVARAACFGRPFRVALPTYAYQLAFDGSGRLIDVIAEEADLDPALAGLDLRRLGADPAAMAELVRGWTDRRPRGLTGVLWYRLPIATDRRNWSAATWRSVMAGRAPSAELALDRRRPSPRLAELDLVNADEQDSPAPQTS